MNDHATHDHNSCPFPHGTAGGSNAAQGTTSKDWWPTQLDLSPLLRHNPRSDPFYGQGFNYPDVVLGLDIQAVKDAIVEVMHDSQDWWPADWGHYGPLFIRLAWHSAGTYRVADGRGGGGDGLQRFAPLNSWPDNVNLDKARRLLWPIKKRFGQSLSWADLMILAGNVALEDMGFPTFGFAFGRTDVWEPDNTYWGNETEWLTNERYAASREADTLDHPLAAVQMGLIYVNPEGPDGNPDFVGAAGDIRETFKRMAMNDEETVALIAGGHAFGKTHGAGDASQVGVEPEGNADLAAAGLGWKNSQGKGHSEDTIGSGLEVTWTPSPTQWDNDYLKMIYGYDNWELEESPAGAKQWRPVADEVHLTPHAHLNEHIEIRMLTTDLALRFGDPEYDRISRKFLEDFDYFTDAFARAWFKLTHRDMGPKGRYQGPEVPAEELLWQDPVPAGNVPSVEELEVIAAKVLASKLTPTDLIKTAWASASSYRNTDKRGGANGARIALEPQRSWPVNDPAHLASVLSQLEAIREEVGGSISLADLIVYAGLLGLAQSGSGAGFALSNVTFGRGDATQEQTDIESFNHLYAMADGFRNWGHKPTAENAEKFLIEKATLLGLTPPEMTALVGGLRVLGVTNYGSTHGVLTNNVGTLSTDYFVNLLDMDIEWRGIDGHLFEGVDRKTDEVKWTATRADLVFSSNSVLRALAEVYASDDGKEIFMDTFTYAWHKVMNADLF